MIKATKKIILIIFIICLVFIPLTCCSELNASKNSRMILIEKSPGYNIVYDQYTRVMYVVSNGTYNYGTFTLLVDEEGKPLLYEG